MIKLIQSFTSNWLLATFAFGFWLSQLFLFTREMELTIHFAIFITSISA